MLNSQTSLITVNTQLQRIKLCKKANSCCHPIQVLKQNLLMQVILKRKNERFILQLLDN